MSGVARDVNSKAFSGRVQSERKKEWKKRANENVSHRTQEKEVSVSLQRRV